MLNFNWLIIILSAFIPLIIGYLWYKPEIYNKVFDTKINEELQIDWSFYNAIILFMFCILYSISISYQVIHQLHIQSVLMNEVGFNKGEGNAYKDLLYFKELYGKNFRSFGHGAFHGLLNSIFIVIPLLYFQKMIMKFSWKLFLYHWIFWAISSTLMGAIICELY